MTDRIWILGASDPEMDAIERLLLGCGEYVAHALDAAEQRVRPYNAYRGVVHRYINGYGALHTPETWYLVECVVLYPEPTSLGREDIPEIVTIDHHRPGDPGFGVRPAAFMRASSIGQVINELARLDVLPRNWQSASSSIDRCDPVVVLPSGMFARVPRDLVLTAAADHCLGAAYQGKCPGVDPDELMQWRAESRAECHGRTVACVLADVEAATSALQQAPRITLLQEWVGCEDHDTHPVKKGCPRCQLEKIEVANMRRETPIPELLEAATRTGIGYISGPLIGPDGRMKYTCSGSAEQVVAFLRFWAPSQGLGDLYGDPDRGFAGGYRP
jgi:hypothetical protein